MIKWRSYGPWSEGFPFDTTAWFSFSSEKLKPWLTIFSLPAPLSEHFRQNNVETTLSWMSFVLPLKFMLHTFVQNVAVAWNQCVVWSTYSCWPTFSLIFSFVTSPILFYRLCGILFSRPVYHRNVAKNVRIEDTHIFRVIFQHFWLRSKFTRGCVFLINHFQCVGVHWLLVYAVQN